MTDDFHSAALQVDRVNFQVTDATSSTQLMTDMLSFKTLWIRVVDWSGRGAHGHDGDLVGGLCVHAIYAAWDCTHFTQCSLICVTNDGRKSKWMLSHDRQIVTDKQLMHLHIPR